MQNNIKNTLNYLILSDNWNFGLSKMWKAKQASLSWFNRTAAEPPSPQNNIKLRLVKNGTIDKQPKNWLIFAEIDKNCVRELKILP